LALFIYLPGLFFPLTFAQSKTNFQDLISTYHLLFDDAFHALCFTFVYWHKQYEFRFSLLSRVGKTKVKRA